MNLAFTISTNSYLPQAVVLGQSYLKHNPGCEFYIALLDEPEPTVIHYIEQHNLKWQCIHDMAIDHFDEMRNRYNAFEMSCAMKPFVAEYFLFNHRCNQIVYFDSDILCLDKLESIEKQSQYSFILTPHSFVPVTRNDSHKNDLGFINHGIYNAGFFACNNTAEALEILNWWKDKLIKNCVIDLVNAKYVDQTWLNLVPIYFNNVLVLKLDGYNVAPWNLYERVITNNNGIYYVNDKPIVFFHFSGFDNKYPNILSKHHLYFTFDNKPEVANIYTEYSNLIISIGNPLNSYNYYKGITIEKTPEKNINNITFLFRAKKWLTNRIKF